MPVSTRKHILFASALDGKVRHLWPVAVFNERNQAKSYAGFVQLAYSTGDKDAIMALDPQAKLDAESNPLKVEKFSIVEVPYAPQPVLAAFEDDEPEAAPTA